MQRRNCLSAAFPLDTGEEQNHRAAGETTPEKFARAVETGKYRLAGIPGNLFGPLSA